MIAINTFKIGADPEYYAIDREGQHVNIRFYTHKHHPEVALDHSGDVLEVKPKPSKYAFRIVRRIKKLLLEHEISRNMLFEGLRFRAGGRVKTSKRSLGLGGHIHCDIPYSNRKWVPNAAAFNTLTKNLEHLDVLPKADSLYRHTYIDVDDVRRANNADRVEFRNMCSWLHSPIATQLCLTAGKLAVACPDTVKKCNSIKELQAWFEIFKTKDTDAAIVVEKIFEPKLKLEARLDVDLKDSWKSLRKLGRVIVR